VVALWGLGLGCFGVALWTPTPLRLDVGAGDEALAAGFGGGAQRHAVRGRITFRWTGEVARLQVPARLWGDELTLTSRLARFDPERVPVALTFGERLVAQWRQGLGGWRLRTDAVGPVSSAVPVVTFWSEPGPAARKGVALDWVEIVGARWALPRAAGWWGLILLCLVVPGLIALCVRSRLPLMSLGPIILLGLGILAWRDPVAALTVAELGGPRALVGVAVLALAWEGLRRGWRAAREAAPWAIAVPATTILAALCLLSNPRYHYPDVDTHARFLAGIRRHPHWAVDPREYQLATRAWTRRIGGRLVGFPYSAAFHVIAWPLAPLLGEVGAAKTVAATAVGVSGLWLYLLVLALRGPPLAASVAQGVFVLLPAVTSRLTLALWPSLLGQSLELLLLLALARGLLAAAALPGGFGRLAVLLAIVQAGYTGSLVNVGAIVGLLAVVLLWRGPRVECARLAAAYLLVATAVVLSQYHHFLPVFFQQVLPYADGGGSSPSLHAGWDLLRHVTLRLFIFLGPILPVLAVAGWRRLGAASLSARRVLLIAVLAGLALALLRVALPVVFGDAKEVELLAGPVSALAALALADLWTRTSRWKLVSLAAAGSLAAWALWRAALLYASRLIIALR
jgi:hypothetical protein